MSRSEKAEEILDVAERMARAGGYQGFSFREIAAAVGVKSASVHYHFPTKEDLGRALAERYRMRFLEGLGDPVTMKTATKAIVHYHQAFRTALMGGGQMCLCGALASAAPSLPSAVRSEMQQFFDANLAWLEAVLDRPDGLASPLDRRQFALQLIARLQGAMLLAGALNDPTAFDEATHGIGLAAIT